MRGAHEPAKHPLDAKGPTRDESPLSAVEPRLGAVAPLSGAMEPLFGAVEQLLGVPGRSRGRFTEVVLWVDFGLLFIQFG